MQRRNVVVRWGLIVLLATDMILVGVNWNLGRVPQVHTGDLNRLVMLEKSYRADNARLERFRRELPADEKQWGDFFTTHFQPEGAGYSAVSQDLGQLSRAAGLQSDSITFHQHNPDARGLMEVDISTAVEGNYDSLIEFLNKLEHSDNFYVLDTLALASSSAGKLRLNLQLRTYFRTT
ncbi:MAG TPA: GspMb/PilO family protein [Candidatus Dormibacteraeota bacterium]|nr:GspMb/PilO family protein [Candidatus Dormibacteraeota bacterium]